MIALLLAGVQVQVPDYQEIVIERPILLQDYPSHYTHYELKKPLLDMAIKQWPHYNINEKKTLLSELSKVTQSQELSAALLEIFAIEKNQLVKRQILSSLTYMKQSIVNLDRLKTIAKDKNYTLDAFAVLARNLKANDLSSYVSRSDDYLIVACLAKNVSDAKLLMSTLDKVEQDYQKLLILRQLARLAYDAAYEKCESDYHRSEFIASTTSHSFLIKQAKSSKFAAQALVRMKQLGWNKSFDSVVKEIMLSGNEQVQLAATSFLVENKNNMAYLLPHLYKLPEAAAVIAVGLFAENSIPVNLQKNFCVLKNNADAVNIAKLAVMEDQALTHGHQSALQLIKKSRNSSVIRVGLRYLGVMKYSVDKSFLDRHLKSRDIIAREGAVFYLAASVKQAATQKLIKYSQETDMNIRQALFDGMAHNPKVDFAKLITPGLKSRKDGKKNPQPSSQVRAYMIWAMAKSDHVNNQNLFELKKLITQKLVKVPMSENVFDPSYVRENAYLCLARWAKAGSSEGKRMFNEVQEFVEWQREQGLEYSDSFEQVLDMAEQILKGGDQSQTYFYSKALAIRLIDRPIR
jgi:hypothetical protein